jgi:pantetheine-phosphate adenylyltransferase
MVKAIYAGTFDPLTAGHIDIITRSLQFCDRLVIAIGINSNKNTMFSDEERQTFIKQTFAHFPNIKVESFQGLLVDYAKEIEANLLVRGIRSVSDFEYEINLANINKVLAPDIETVFLPTSPQLAVVSSSMVKEIAKHGGDISKFAPEHVVKAVKGKFGFIKTGKCDNPSCDGTCNGLHSASLIPNCKYPGCSKVAIGGKLGLTMCKKHQPFPAKS